MVEEVEEIEMVAAAIREIAHPDNHSIMVVMVAMIKGICVKRSFRILPKVIPMTHIND